MTAEADRVEALRAQLDTSMRVEQQVNALLSRLEAASSRLNTYVLPAEPATDEVDAAAAAGRTAAEAKLAALEAKVAALEATREPAQAAVQDRHGLVAQGGVQLVQPPLARDFEIQNLMKCTVS